MSSRLDYEIVRVPVEGGELAVGIWGGSGPAVLACHGITASHMEFKALAETLGNEVRLIAPDLRGRGASNGIAGPWGMRAHAADVVAVLKFIGIKRADLVIGHSMGGFVAAVAAAEYPEVIGPVLMVDGGLPLAKFPPLHKLPFGDYLIEKVVQRIIGPSLTRLDMTFASVEAYRAFWRDHPALKDEWSTYVEDYVDYDLAGEAPALRPRVRKDAVLSDVRTQLFENLVPRSLATLRGPVHFLRAPRGIMNGKPLYPPARLKKASAGIAGFTMDDVVDVNHFTIVISERGAAAVAAAARRMLNGN